MPSRLLRAAWTRLADAFVERQTDWRQLQRRTDTLQLFLLATAYEEGIDRAQALAERLLPLEQGDAARPHTSTLRTLWKRYVLAVAEPLPNEERLADYEDQCRVVERVNEQQVQRLLAAADSRAPTAARPSFTLLETTSRASTAAGTGVQLNGHARIGTVVAFYPGIAYHANLWSHMPGYPHVAAQNPYLFARYDRVIIDAYPQFEIARALMGVPALDEPLLRLSERVNSSEMERDWWASLNPYALGHRVNHPPQGTAANVMPCAWTFDVGRLAPGLLRFLPNRCFMARGRRPNTAESPWSTLWFRYYHWISDWTNEVITPPTLIPGLVLVALRDLRDEELFLNYRYNPAALQQVKTPSWYCQADAEAARRRWSS